jgi:hypothetical protein
VENELQAAAAAGGSGVENELQAAAAAGGSGVENELQAAVPTCPPCPGRSLLWQRARCRPFPVSAEGGGWGALMLHGSNSGFVVWILRFKWHLDVILRRLPKGNAAVAKALFDQVLVLCALLMMLATGFVVCNPDFAVSAEPLGSRHPLFGHGGWREERRRMEGGGGGGGGGGG